MINVLYYVHCDSCKAKLTTSEDKSNLLEKAKDAGALVTGHGKCFCNWNCLHNWLYDNPDIALEAL